MIPKKSESKYVSALPKILNGPSLLTWWSAMSSIIFDPFRLLVNAHLFNWLFRWLLGVDVWCRSCTPEVRIWRRVREKIKRISNLLKTFKVRMLSNLNANFVTSLVFMSLICVEHGEKEFVFAVLILASRWRSDARETKRNYWSCSRRQIFIWCCVRLSAAEWHLGKISAGELWLSLKSDMVWKMMPIPTLPHKLGPIPILTRFILTYPIT